MPSAEPTRLTDDLWLAAHDERQGKPHIGEVALGVGMAVGLIAELVHGKLYELRGAQLFRTTAELPDDPTLSPLLQKMAEEEQSAPPSVRAHARMQTARDDFDWPPAAHGTPRWPPAADDGRGWTAAAPYDDLKPRHARVRQEEQHRPRGHDLRRWMSYLSYERCGELHVIDRLARRGLVHRQERRQLFGGVTVRYVPYDSVVSGLPANRISFTVSSGRLLPLPDLLLAGLFLATGLHHHALATLSPSEHALLSEQLVRRLDDPSRTLLRAADAAVGDAAMR
jgi:hypothetical protein